jgi:surface polysaccharide O-acyltransferase-like enzyme
VAIAYRLMPNLMKKLSWTAGSAGSLVVMVLTLNIMATVPVHMFMTHQEWFRLAGPLQFPASRLLLYFVCFLLGIALGAANPGQSLSRENLRLWPLWLIIGAFGFAAHVIFLSGKYPADTPIWMMKLILSTAFSFCCSFTCLALLGLARSLFRTNWPAADHFSENAYGIYIFHYGFVIWLQFGLLAQPMPALVKFLITFSGALTASWFLSALLHKTAANKVL